MTCVPADVHNTHCQFQLRKLKKNKKKNRKAKDLIIYFWVFKMFLELSHHCLQCVWMLPAANSCFHFTLMLTVSRVKFCPPLSSWTTEVDWDLKLAKKTTERKDRTAPCSSPCLIRVTGSPNIPFTRCSCWKLEGFRCTQSEAGAWAGLHIEGVKTCFQINPGSRFFCGLGLRQIMIMT